MNHNISKEKNMKTIASLLITLFLTLPALAQQANVKSSTVNILPHRAYYTVKLKSAKADSSVKDTEGKMIIELTHDCDGWTLKQESASVIDLKSAKPEMMRSVYVAQESDDGKTLKFKTERVFDEKMKDSVEGFAGFTDKGGTISYKSPEDKEIIMKVGTLPPIAHMKRLIEMAETGEQSSSIQVFDGSFYGNPVLIDAFVAGKLSSCKSVVKNCEGYPMNLAVYAMPSTTSNPNFEIKQIMGKEGVMRNYTIDFTDYTVEGTLDKVEYLPANVCNKK